VLDRRQLLSTAAAPLGLAGCSVTPVQTYPSIGAALGALQALPAGVRTKAGWDLARVLHHAAQSVEFSMTAFPEPKSALFRATVGPVAFAVFDARGRMSHGLTEPIPGAPPLADGTPLLEAVARVTKALRDFDAWTGPLAPHFAYGALDKAAYARAHLMHLADHWTEVVAA
jgi:Protein of unknown function (DUF1569)